MDGTRLVLVQESSFTDLNLCADQHHAMSEGQLSGVSANCGGSVVSKSPELRVRLRAFLEKLHDEYEAADPSQEGLEIMQLLAPVLSALDDLEHGETPPVFKPTPTKRRGSRPAQVRRLQLWALRHEAALRRLPMKKQDARSAVAAKYDVTEDAIKTWERYLKRDSTAELSEAIRLDARLYGTRKKLGWPLPSEEGILKAADHHGRAYQLVRPRAKNKTKGG